MTQHLSVLSVIVGLTAWHGVNKVCVNIVCVNIVCVNIVCVNITASSAPVIFFLTRSSNPPPVKCLLCLEAQALLDHSWASLPS